MSFSPLFGVLFLWWLTLLDDQLTGRIAGGLMTLTGVFIIACGAEAQIADTGLVNRQRRDDDVKKKHKRSRRQTWLIDARRFSRAW